MAHELHDSVAGELQTLLVSVRLGAVRLLRTA
jgi:hypothetical protein